MKFVIVFAAVLALAVALPAGDPKDDTVVKYDADVRPDGYNFGYEISDGTVRQEEAHLNPAGNDPETGEPLSNLAVKGSISWVAPDGQTYTLNYIADENGFQPEAAHLPTLG